MCAPGSKVWDRALGLWRWYQAFVITMTMGYALFASWLMSVYLPFELEQFELEYKEYASPDASDEIQGVQNYVAALGNIEVETGNVVYNQAAFDLAADEPLLVFQGIRDWDAFWSPVYAHIHQAVAQQPLTWRCIDNYVDVGHCTEMPRPSKPFRGPCCAQHNTTTTLACSMCSHFSCLYHGGTVNDQWVCGCCA